MRHLKTGWKKVRGIKRRLRALNRWVQSFSDYFPPIDEFHNGYWFLKVAIHQGLVEGPYAKYGVKRAVISALVELCELLHQIKPEMPSKFRVVALIKQPDLFSSGIDVFGNDEAYTDFITRTGPEQIWKLLPAHRSLKKDWNLPVYLQEVGFAEEINDLWDDEKYHAEGEVWLVGDVK